MTKRKNEAAAGPFGTDAPKYWALGLSVVPLQPGSKRPAQEISGWQGYVNEPPSLTKQEEWLARYPDRGIGLLTGGPLPSGERLGAIDVDQDEFVRLTEVILCLR
jgi:Bifunctional DNA primase/polymerase, N-terminal